MTMTLKLVQRRGEDGIIGCALESRAGSGQSPQRSKFCEHILHAVPRAGHLAPNR
jgi:hypothetical protein